MTLAERVEYITLNTAALLARLKILPVLLENKKPVILCFHSVGNDKWRFSVSKKMFESQIKYLSENKKVVSLDKILSGPKNARNQVALTFDDGYQNWHRNVLPICQKYGVTGTIFLLGRPECANREELKNKLPLLKRSEILDFVKSGWEIGSHTMTHSDLRSLTPEELDKEIAGSKKLLEKDLNVEIKYLAYPRGFYSADILNQVKRAGYKAAFTIDGGYALLEKKYQVNRVSLEGKLNFDQFKILTGDFGIRFYWYFMRALKLKESIVFKISDRKKYLRRDLRLLIESPIEYIYSFRNSTSQKAKVWPYSPVAKEVADGVISSIEQKCRPGQKVHLVGSVPLKIAGDKDVDIVVETNMGGVREGVAVLSEVLGQPVKVRKNFAEWNFRKRGYSVEVVLTHSQSRLFKLQMTTFNAIRTRKEYISQYNELKLASNGLPMREYQRRRIEFFNSVLSDQKRFSGQEIKTGIISSIFVFGTSSKMIVTELIQLI